MKTRARWIVPMAFVAAWAATLAGCKKPDEPVPAPQAAQTEITQSDSGTTTTFAPPAPEPQEDAGANAAE